MKQDVRMKNNEDDNEDSFDFKQQVHLPFFESKQVVTHLQVYLDEAIREAKYYRPLINSINNLDENDTLNISINSYGGYVDGAIAIINAFENCRGRVICTVDGVAASAASIIALASPQINICPYSCMMIHAASFGSFGKQSDVISHASFVDKHIKTLMSNVYKDFLTEQEFAEVLLGREMWFDSEEIIKRLEKRAKIQEKRNKQVEKEMKKSEKKPKVVIPEEVTQI